MQHDASHEAITYRVPSRGGTVPAGGCPRSSLATSRSDGAGDQNKDLTETDLQMRYRVIEGKVVKVGEDEAPPLTTFSRRKFIGGSFLAVGAAALTGCGLPGFGGTGASGSRTGSRAGGGGVVGGGGWFGGGGSGGRGGGGGS